MGPNHHSSPRAAQWYFLLLDFEELMLRPCENDARGFLILLGASGESFTLRYFPSVDCQSVVIADDEVKLIMILVEKIVLCHCVKVHVTN